MRDKEEKQGKMKKTVERPREEDSEKSREENQCLFFLVFNVPQLQRDHSHTHI